MAAGARKRRRHKASRRAKRWLLGLMVALFGGTVVTIGQSLYQRYRTPPSEVLSRVAVPEPPSLEGVADPAVKRLLSDCRAALLRSPQAAAAWGKLGMALLAHDYYDEAKGCFVTAERLDPRDPRWPYFQGTIQTEKNPDEAIPALERAAKLCAETPDAPRLQLAELLLANGRLDQAGEQFQLVLRRSPTNARAHLGLGRVTLMRGELAASQAHLAISVRDGHTQKASHLLLAQIYERLGDPARADQESRQANVPNDPAWPDPYLDEVLKLQTGMKPFLIGVNLLLEQGRLDLCIAQCRNLLRDSPDSDMIWLTLGKALVQKRDFPAAQEALRKVLQIVPDSVQAHFQLGFAAYLQRDYREAVSWYRKATELKPDFTFAYHDLGHCLILAGDQAGAIAAFQAALRCQPDLSDVHRVLGDLLLKDGQWTAAVEHLHLAMQLKPSDATARQLLQQALQRLTIPAIL